MQNLPPSDPYTYPNSDVLINKFDIQDAKALLEVESYIFALKTTESLPSGDLDYAHLKSIHYYFFEEIYHWAGNERTVDISKQDSYFAHHQYIEKELAKLFKKLSSDNFLRNLNSNDFCSKLSYYFNEINAAHPFREGNGRTLRAFCDALADKAGYLIDWSKVSHNRFIDANIHGFNGEYKPMEDIFLDICSPIQLTKEIDISLNTIVDRYQEDLLQYIDIQQAIADFVSLKYQHITTDNIQSNHFSSKISSLNSEAKNIAHRLSNNPDINSFIKKNSAAVSSISTQGGFKIIHEKIKSQNASQNDWLAVIRHSQKNAIRNNLSQTQGNQRKK